jgi:hypothetical protein
LHPIEQLEQFLTGNQAVTFLVAGSKEERYRAMNNVNFSTSGSDCRNYAIAPSQPTNYMTIQPQGGDGFYFLFILLVV